MWATIDDQLLSRFRSSPAVRERIAAVEEAVRSGLITPTAAANELLELGRSRD